MLPPEPALKEAPEIGAPIEMEGRPTTVKLDDAEAVPPRLLVSLAARV